jgi:hypothetical protein
MIRIEEMSVRLGIEAFHSGRSRGRTVAGRSGRHVI